MQTRKAGGKQISLLSLAIFLAISQVKTSQGTLVGFSDAANNNTLEPLTAVGVITLVVSQLLAMTVKGYKSGSAIPREQRQVLSSAEVSAH